MYLDRQLVGYDVVGNTPFEVDLTGLLKPGTEAQLEVRITNPGGNYAWNDSRPLKWGRFLLPMSHGFGGITGPVRLVATDPVSIDDLYVQNTPTHGRVNAVLSLRNATGAAVTRGLTVQVVSKTDPAEVVFRRELASVPLPPGDSPLTVAIDAPDARTWDLTHPWLYECRVEMRDGSRVVDDTTRTFGFRWFTPVGIGEDARLHLNGRRIMLRTAISWGHWPVNGIFPTPELAVEQVRAAKSLGLNMLNFHRAIGNPLVLDAADELGLLYFEEPGGYVSGGTDPFAQALAREKLLRMVRRDRSHSSLVIHKMINEQWNQFGADKDPAQFAVHRADLQAAHALDPGRLLLDGYAINGWEATLVDNHSGVVDAYRHPKADPALLAFYTEPLHVAVKPRQQIVELPATVVVDFFTVNEIDLKGPHVLKIRALDPAGKVVFTRDVPVELQGSDVFAQLAAEAVRIPVSGSPGMYRLEGVLTAPDGREEARGHDQILAVDWKSARFSPRGAVDERNGRVAAFLQENFDLATPRFDGRQGKLDWLVVNRPAVAEPFIIPTANLRDRDGQAPGLHASFHAGNGFGNVLREQRDEGVDFSWPAGVPVNAAVSATGDYSVRWDGFLLPTVSGNYLLDLRWQGAACLWIDGKQVLDKPDASNRQRNEKLHATLTAGSPVSIRLKYYRPEGDGLVRLSWQPPASDADGASAAEIFRRAREDGTTVFVLARPETWINAISKETGSKIGGPYKIGNNWLGGQFFVRDHPLFKGLPVDQALDWPYQAVLENGRQCFDMQGEETVCGAYQSWPFHLGTSVAVLPCGKGRIVVSTLDVCDRLLDPASPAEVARQLFCNDLEFASAR